MVNPTSLREFQFQVRTIELNIASIQKKFNNLINEKDKKLIIKDLDHIGDVVHSLNLNINVIYDLREILKKHEYKFTNYKPTLIKDYYSVEVFQMDLFNQVEVIYNKISDLTKEFKIIISHYNNESKIIIFERDTKDQITGLFKLIIDRLSDIITLLERYCDTLV